MLDISVGGGVEIIITEQIYSHWKFLENIKKNIKGGKERRELHRCMKLYTRINQRSRKFRFQNIKEQLVGLQ